MFRYTDEPRHPHPTPQRDKLENGLIVLALSSGACALLGICILAGLL